MDELDTEQDLITFRVQARALAKRLERRADAGDLTCEACGHALALPLAQVLLLECGHEVLLVPCPTEGCPNGAGVLFEPRGADGHAADDDGVRLPLPVWRAL